MTAFLTAHVPLAQAIGWLLLIAGSGFIVSVLVITSPRRGRRR